MLKLLVGGEQGVSAIVYILGGKKFETLCSGAARSHFELHVEDCSEKGYSVGNGIYVDPHR